MRISQDRVSNLAIAARGLVCLTSLVACVSAAGIARPIQEPSTSPLESSWPAPRIYKITLNSDDGTECDDVWYPSGITMGTDCIGKDCATDLTAAFRFAVTDLEQGEVVKYARLLLSAQGGTVTSGTGLCIRGIDEDSPASFSAARRPSQLPQTDDSVAWCFNRAWEVTGVDRALYRASPNIACIINEILSRPDWGQGVEGKQIALVIGQSGCAPGEANYLEFEDFSTEWELRDPATLEIYRSLAEAFLGKQMLGRVTDSSVVVNVMSLLEIDIYAEYGTASGIYDFSTAPLLNRSPEQAVEIEISGLLPDTTYHYRLRYREAGTGTYSEGMEGSFRTQRPPQSTFVFAVQSDAHPHLVSSLTNPAIDWNLYKQTLSNISADDPDFLIDMGDFVDIECEGYSRNILSAKEAETRYLEHRKYLDKITHSIPFYLVLGNHEAEQGWRAVNEDDSVEVWAARGRKMLIPNPKPGGFYTGSQESTACCGLREDYYAWEWGDALFVAIDPFWHTTKVPHWYSEYPRQGDGWEWTLGQEQYDWLYRTLHNSGAKWKFVFAHHEVGGVLTGNSYYGRGGIESAKYRVAGRPSFEWGGEDVDGNNVFSTKRPGWEHGPIHDIMAGEGVAVFFHGHDHVYVSQTLDGILYQACPRPKDSSYSDGFYGAGQYASGTKCNNSGHLRITVSPDAVELAYVRSVLPEHEPLLEGSTLVYNGDISHTHSVILSGVRDRQGSRQPPRLFPVHPNPFRTSTAVDFFVPTTTPVRIAIYDARGRLLRVLLDEPVASGLHRVSWDGRTTQGQMSPGIYFCRFTTGKSAETAKVMLIK